MRIEATIRPRFARGAIILIFALVALSVLVLARANAASGPIGGFEHRLPSEDVQRLSDVLLGSPPTAVAITEAGALQAAAEHYDAEKLGASSVDAFLETITVLGTMRGPEPLQGRPAWIIRLAGMSQQHGGPFTADGPATVHVLTVAYVFIDAESGDFMFTEWQE